METKNAIIIVEEMKAKAQMELETLKQNGVDMVAVELQVAEFKEKLIAEEVAKSAEKIAMLENDILAYSKVIEELVSKDSEETGI